MQEMTAEERKVIQRLDNCDFTEMHRYFADRTAARKGLSREEKQVRLCRAQSGLGSWAAVGGCWCAWGRSRRPHPVRIAIPVGFFWLSLRRCGGGASDLAPSWSRTLPSYVRLNVFKNAGSTQGTWEGNPPCDTVGGSVHSPWCKCPDHRDWAPAQPLACRSSRGSRARLTQHTGASGPPCPPTTNVCVLFYYAEAQRRG